MRDDWKDVPEGYWERLEQRMKLPAEIVEACWSALVSAEFDDLDGWEIALIERRIREAAMKRRAAAAMRPSASLEPDEAVSK